MVHYRRMGWNRFGGHGQLGILSRQDWVEIRRTAAGRAGLPWMPAGRKFWKIDYRKRVFQAFHALSFSLQEWVIPRKWRGELDSDPKMNQTEWWLPVHEQPRSAVAGRSESTCDQLGCSPTEWIIQKLHCNIYYRNRNSAEKSTIQFVTTTKMNENSPHHCTS